MNLGLDQLTDGQLLELLQQAWCEVSTRSAFIQWCAVEDNETAAEKVERFRQALVDQIAEARLKSREELRSAIKAELREEIERGEIRLIPREEEAKLIATATLEAKIAMIDEAVMGLQNGVGERFFCEITGNTITVSFGRRKISAMHHLGSVEIAAIQDGLRRVLAG